MHDILIKGGTIIDGSGQPRFRGDVAINDDKITQIGDLSGQKAEREIDATDLFVTPGYIDISNRSDVYWRLFQDTTMASLLYQGITTIICGNSGASLAPIHNEQMLKSTQKWTDIKGTNVDWHTMSEFLDAVEERDLAPHFATFVGHGTIRRGLVGDEARALTEDELATLLVQTEQALDGGALGVSLGLLYTHERDTTRDELLAIAKLVKSKDKLLVAHLRNEDAELITSLDEILDITAQTEVRTHITHLKAVGQDTWPLMKDAISQIDKMVVDGFDVSFDVYPYTMTGSVLYTFLPHWASEGGKKMMLARLQSESTRKQIYKELKLSKIKLGQAIVSIAPQASQLRGRKLSEIAADRDVDVETLILDLLLASDGRVIILFDALSEENIVRALESPYSVVTSNSPGYTLDESPKDGEVLIAHPRSFGAFPRLFSRYVQERKSLSWELAVHKSTFKVAQRCGLDQRGVVRPGFYADIAISDPSYIKDVATPQDLRYAKGMRHLIIGGKIIIDDGDLTRERSGQVLRVGK